MKTAKNIISDGVVHKLPLDSQKALMVSPSALAQWEDITPLARNEWICWVGCHIVEVNINE